MAKDAMLSEVASITPSSNVIHVPIFVDFLLFYYLFYFTIVFKVRKINYLGGGFAGSCLEGGFGCGRIGAKGGVKRGGSCWAPEEGGGGLRVGAGAPWACTKGDGTALRWDAGGGAAAGLGAMKEPVFFRGAADGGAVEVAGAGVVAGGRDTTVGCSGGCNGNALVDVLACWGLLGKEGGGGLLVAGGGVIGGLGATAGGVVSGLGASYDAIVLDLGRPVGVIAGEGVGAAARGVGTPRGGVVIGGGVVRGGGEVMGGGRLVGSDMGGGGEVSGTARI